MFYSETVKKACNVMFNAHNGQFDKGGYPYVLHPIHLAEQMDDEYSVVTALLHDVAEDTSVTLDDLKSLGFPKEVLEAIKLLTHNPDVPYLEYIENLKQNEIARKVKLADLKHNSDASRVFVFDEKAEKRLEKYKKAIEILTEK